MEVIASLIAAGLFFYAVVTQRGEPCTRKMPTAADNPTCSECGAEIVVALSVVDGFAPWL